MYHVYQIVSLKESCKEKKQAWREVLFDGAEGYKPELMEFYDHVADVDATNLDQIFMIMNRWEPSDEALVTRHAPLHSLSVGDVLIDSKTGQASMVNPCGFAEIKFNKLERHYEAV